MSQTKKGLTQVKLKQNYKVLYKKKEIFGGLISWWVEVKRDKFGEDLIINTTEKFDSIIINGREIKLEDYLKN